MKQNTIILMVVLLLVVGGVSFTVGYKVAEGKNMTGTFARNGAGQMVGRGARDGAGGIGQQVVGMIRGGNRQTIGEVISFDDKTMTVKMMDGSSKIILLSSAMTINKSVEALKTDLKTGSKVAVFGTTNQDGSVTAQSIELDPRMPNLTGIPQK